MGIPPINSQITFIIKLMHPELLAAGTTLEPKGHNAMIPNLKDCKPKGIPMIVIINKNPAVKYSKAIIKPPQIIQIIFPNVFIFFYFFKASTTELFFSRM